MPKVTRYVCIHGHFYQPPRENPWLEQVETQDSAAPFHDWNERITSECYAPNGASRVLNKQNEIIRILNNYSHISFNFGPTLLSWLEANAPNCGTEQMHLEEGSQERVYWHLGYMVALRDTLRLLTGQETLTQRACTTDNSNLHSQA